MRFFIKENYEDFFEEKQLRNYKPEIKKIYYEIKKLKKKYEKEIKKQSDSIDSLSSNSRELYLKEQEKRKIQSDRLSIIRSDRLKQALEYQNKYYNIESESYKKIERIYKTLSFREKENFYKSYFDTEIKKSFKLKFSSIENTVNTEILKAEEIFYGITNIDLKRKEFEDKIEIVKNNSKSMRNNLIRSLKLNQLKEQEKQKEQLKEQEEQKQKSREQHKKLILREQELGRIFRKQEQDLLEEKRLKEIREKEELDKLKTHQTAMLKRLEYEKSLADFKRDRKTRTLRRY